MILLTIGCPGVGGLSSPSLPEDISSAPPKRSIVPLLSSIKEGKCAVLISMRKIPQSYHFNIFPRRLTTPGNPPALLWASLSKICPKCLWSGKGATPVKGTSFTLHLLHPVLLSFKPRSPDTLLQSIYSNLGLKQPIPAYSLHSLSNFKIIGPCLPSSQAELHLDIGKTTVIIYIIKITKTTTHPPTLSCLFLIYFLLSSYHYPTHYIFNLFTQSPYPTLTPPDCELYERGRYLFWSLL